MCVPIYVYVVVRCQRPMSLLLLSSLFLVCLLLGCLRRQHLATVCIWRSEKHLGSLVLSFYLYVDSREKQDSRVSRFVPQGSLLSMLSPLPTILLIFKTGSLISRGSLLVVASLMLWLDWWTSEPLESACFHPLVKGLQLQKHPTFTQILGTWTQILTLFQQALCSLGDLLSPAIFIVNTNLFSNYNISLLRDLVSRTTSVLVAHLCLSSRLSCPNLTVDIIKQRR